MSSTNAKRALYAQFAAVAKALAHEHRLELIELVAQGERSSRRWPRASASRWPTLPSICSTCGGLAW